MRSREPKHKLNWTAHERKCQEMQTERHLLYVFGVPCIHTTNFCVRSYPTEAKPILKDSKRYKPQTSTITPSNSHIWAPAELQTNLLD